MIANPPSFCKASLIPAGTHILGVIMEYTKPSFLKLFPEVPYYPIVSFANEADIKVKTDKDVVYEEFLLRTITSYMTEVISDDLKNEIFDYLKKIKMINSGYGKKHVESIKDGRSRKNLENKSNACPKCGSLLKERNGKYDSFLGCSNYPGCKFTIDNN